MRTPPPPPPSDPSDSPRSEAFASATTQRDRAENALPPNDDTQTDAPRFRASARVRKTARDGARIAVGGVLVFWFALLASFLWRTEFFLWHQGPSAPFGVFSHLIGSYTFSWANCPPAQLALGVAALALYWWVGWLFLRLFDVYFPRFEDAALSLLFGAGLCGLGFEFLGMAGWLTRGPVVGVLVALIAGLIAAGRWRAKQPLEVWHASDRRRLRARLKGDVDENASSPEDDAADGPLDDGFVPFDPRARYAEIRQGRLGHDALESVARDSVHPPESRWTLRGVWRRQYSRTLSPQDSPTATVAWSAAFVLIAVVTLLTFYHALFYPETYWDALILYLGYGRMTYLEGGLPFKACAQVGIGLGANYPHLYSTHAAAVAAAVGHWSDVPARLFAPAAALAAMVLIYGAALRLWRHRLVAIVCALVFRALPYTIAYSTYASDYALAMLFTAALLYLAVVYIDTPLPGVFVALTFVPALAMHLNFLMGALWGVWAITLLVAHWRRPRAALDLVAAGEAPLHPDEPCASLCDPGESAADDTPPADPLFAQAWGVPGPLGLLATRRFWIALVLAAVLGSTWNVRNWWLTGNPVYAFFPDIFGGIRINEEVLRSAEIEWFENGDGIGRLAAVVPRMERLVHPDDELTTLTPAAAEREAARRGDVVIEPPARTLRDRLAASWMFWVGFETFHYSGEGDRLARGRWRDRARHLLFRWRLPLQDRPLEFGGVWFEDEAPGRDEARSAETEARRMRPMRGTAVMHWRHAYKLAPTTVGLALPGAVLWGALAVLGLVARWRANRQAPGLRTFDLTVRFGAVVVACAFVFLLYEYVIADFYLYQIIPMVTATSLLAGWPGAWLLAIAAQGGRKALAMRVLFGVLFVVLLGVGLVPGVAMGLMGFKFTGTRQYGPETLSQLNLGAFRHPGMPAQEFLRLQYGDDVDAWRWVNRHLEGQRLLTHENRHYVFDPSITLVHLDDWDIQKTYTMTDDHEKMALLRELGIAFYLETPNEKKHPINRRVGLEAWKDTPLMIEERRWGDNVLHRFDWTAAGLPADPPDPPAPLESYEPLRRGRRER